MLPISLPFETIDALAASPAPLRLNVDLEAQVVVAEQQPDVSIPFEIGAFAKRLLIEGLDPLALTLKSRDKIQAFFADDVRHRPWVYSAG